MQLLFCIVIVLVVGGQGKEGERLGEVEVYGLVEMVEGDEWHEEGDQAVYDDRDDNADHDSNHTNYIETKPYLDTAIVVKKKCEKQDLPLLLLFIVFIFIIILMLLSEWINPLEVLRSSKHQMVIIEE